ncbi:hemerythrin domain-containing protein [Stieleria varia]
MNKGLMFSEHLNSFVRFQRYSIVICYNSPADESSECVHWIIFLRSYPHLESCCMEEIETSWTRLQKAFVDDHRQMTRGYQHLLDLLGNRDFPSAAREASRLDTVAGPHIEFEERYLYPEVERVRGDDCTITFDPEHAGVLSVIAELRVLPHDAAPKAESVAAWKQHLRSGINHASACGALLNELKDLPEDEQTALLTALMGLREKGSRWTEMEPPADKND